MDSKIKKNVLFVCEGNACRSIMAEALGNFYWGNVIIAASAGISPMEEIPGETFKVLDEIRVPTIGLHPKSIKTIDIGSFDIIINFALISIEEYLPVNFTGKIIDWYVRDPYRGSLDSFRQTRNAIEWFITDIFPRYIGL